MYSEYLTKLMIVFTIVVVITCMNGVFAENGEVVIETVNDYSQAPDNPTNLQYANTFGENIKTILEQHGVFVIHWTDSLAYRLFVIGKYSVNEEYNLLIEILGSRISLDQVDNNGMRVYRLDYGVKICSDGFGMFWIEGYKKYDHYENASDDIYNSIVNKIRYIVNNRSNGLIHVEIINISPGGMIETYGEAVTGNKTLQQMNKTIYSLEVKLSYTIDGIPLFTEFSIVVDYEGDLVGGGFFIPKIIDMKRIDAAIDREKALNAVNNYIQSKYGSLNITDVSNLVYVYMPGYVDNLQYLEQGKAYLLPGYEVEAKTSNGKVAFIAGFVNNDEIIVYDYASAIYASGQSNIDSNIDNEEGVDDSSITPINIVLYALVAILIIVILLVFIKMRL